jgi:hypothetical protein
MTRSRDGSGDGAAAEPRLDREAVRRTFDRLAAQPEMALAEPARTRRSDALYAGLAPPEAAPQPPAQRPAPRWRR